MLRRRAIDINHQDAIASDAQVDATASIDVFGTPSADLNHRETIGAELWAGRSRWSPLRTLCCGGHEPGGRSDIEVSDQRKVVAQFDYGFRFMHIRAREDPLIGKLLGREQIVVLPWAVGPRVALGTHVSAGWPVQASAILQRSFLAVDI